MMALTTTSFAMKATSFLLLVLIILPSPFSLVSPPPSRSGQGRGRAGGRRRRRFAAEVCVTDTPRRQLGGFPRHRFPHATAAHGKRDTPFSCVFADFCFPTATPTAKPKPPLNRSVSATSAHGKTKWPAPQSLPQPEIGRRRRRLSLELQSHHHLSQTCTSRVHQLLGKRHVTASLPSGP